VSSSSRLRVQGATKADVAALRGQLSRIEKLLGAAS
jgi:hypothetical protein